MKAKPHHLPHSVDAEKAVLGAVLLDNNAFDQAKALGPADFFLESHRSIFVVMRELCGEGIPIDLVTLAEELYRREEMNAIGGPAYLSSLTDGLPKLSSIEHYTKIVRDKAALRRGIYAAQDIMTAAQREPEDIEKFLAWAKDSLPAPSGNGSKGPTPLIALSIEELLSREIKQREMLLEPILPEQGLALLYALRGIGKTYLALGVAAAVAGGGSFLHWKAPRPRRVLFVDGELPGKTLQERAAMIVAGMEVEPAPGALRIITPDMQNRPMPDLATPEGQAILEPHLDGIDLVILDNLSALCRSGRENEGESWLPVQGWALNLRRRGMSVLFIHHAGKGGAQRGTSRREDLLDTVITLKHPADYGPNEGLRCEVHFEKTRAMFGDAAKPFEVKLETGSGGAAIWTMSALEDVRAEAAAEMFAGGMTVRDVAKELNIGVGTAGRLRKAWKDGTKSGTRGACSTVPPQGNGTVEQKPNGAGHASTE